MHFINLGICNAVVQGIFSFDESLDEKLLAESLDRLLESEPILKCRWVEQPGCPRWEPVTSEQPERFQVVLTTNVQQDLDDFMSAPLDPRTDSLIQIRVFRIYEPDGIKDTVCFKMSHVVSDVAGLRYFVLKLGETYAKLKENPDYQPPKPVARCGGWQVFFQLPSRLKTRLFQKGRKDFIKKGQWRIPFNSQGTGQMTYETRTFNSEKVAALSDYAKNKGASLNQVMLTAFARALHRFTRAETDTLLPLINTFDLRHYLRRDECPGICNLSVPLVPEVVFRANDSFEQTLAQLKTEMLEHKKSVPGVFQALSIELLFLAPFSLVNQLIKQSLAQVALNGASTPLFSDGGSANVGIPGHKVRHIYGVGPIAYPPTFMVTLSAFQDTVTLATGFCQEAIARQAIVEFFDLIEEELSFAYVVSTGINSASQQESNLLAK